ncbi:MAG: adenosylhomocysteinase [Candidatus Omnitrophota bacterium]|nr:MAG: adenosylhomocysteinase [Candidatus Omnitrophota bacterium]
MNYHVKDLKLAKKGRLRIEWAGNNMPVLKQITRNFEKTKPLKGINIGCCLHVTSETANLVLALKAAGGNVALCASNPLSTQDDVAASLVKNYNVSTFAIKAEDNKTYYRHVNSVLDIRPCITMDDGADLVSTVHKKRKNLTRQIYAGTEETTTGVIRLRSLQKRRLLLFPIIAVNDANTKYLFDNRYGTGQSTIDGIIRATNKLLAGSIFVVCGYGWCGRGIAMRAKGAGANVIVTEANPLRALEAVMDGYRVMPLKEAAKLADIIVTSTGDIAVISKQHFKIMKDGAILANAGHFNVEIDIKALASLSKRVRYIRDFNQEFTLKDGKRIYLLGEGRLVNLASAEGHPASVMDMSFSNQALCAEFIAKNKGRLETKVYQVPKQIDDKIALLKLKSMNIKIDRLTSQQKNYLSSWELGT